MAVNTSSKMVFNYQIFVSKSRWCSQGLVDARPKWGRKWRKFEEKWENLPENVEKFRKWSYLTHPREWEASYGPACKEVTTSCHLWETLGFQSQNLALKSLTPHLLHTAERLPTLFNVRNVKTEEFWWQTYSKHWFSDRAFYVTIATLLTF